MRIVTVSSRRQITLPVDLSKDLNIRPASRLLIERKDENIMLKPLKGSVIDEVGGSLTRYIHPSKLNQPFNKVLEETKKIVAQKLARK